MSFNIKQTGLALCLMASLLIGHASGCTCPTHETHNISGETCSADHGSGENIEPSENGNSISEECVCVVEQPSPYAAPQANRQIKTGDKAITPEQLAPGVQSAVVVRFQQPAAELAIDPSYSVLLKALLPSRAPPRV